MSWVIFFANICFIVLYAWRWKRYVMYLKKELSTTNQALRTTEKMLQDIRQDFNKQYWEGDLELCDRVRIMEPDPVYFFPAWVDGIVIAKTNSLYTIKTDRTHWFKTRSEILKIN